MILQQLHFDTGSVETCCLILLGMSAALAALGYLVFRLGATRYIKMQRVA